MKNCAAVVLVSLLGMGVGHAAGLKSQLLAIDTALWAAWGNKDGAPFRKNLTEDAIYINASAAVPAGGRDLIADEVQNRECNRESFKIENVSLRELAPTVAVLSYQAWQKGECEGTPLPMRVHAASIYVKQGNSWLLTHYQETPIDAE